MRHGTPMHTWDIDNCPKCHDEFGAGRIVGREIAERRKAEGMVKSTLIAMVLTLPGTLRRRGILAGIDDIYGMEG